MDIQEVEKTILKERKRKAADGNEKNSKTCGALFQIGKKWHFYNKIRIFSEKNRYSLEHSTEGDERTYVHVFYRPRKYLSDYLPIVCTFLVFMVSCCSLNRQKKTYQINSKN